MSMIQSDLLLGQEGGAGYVVQRSLRFSSIDSAYLSRTPTSAGNRKTWTWAGWVKRSALSTNQNIFGTNSATGLYFTFQPDNTFVVQDYTGSVQNYALFTTQVFRDTSAWLHILFALDTTQATASNRIKLYINGVQVTSFSTQINPSLNYDGVVNTATTHTLGRLDAQYYFNGYLADVHFIDGQALTPSSFTEVSATTGQLIPKQYTGSFGTNGFWLKFSDNSAATATTLGKDYSGNNNNWSPNNVSVITGGPTSVAAASGALPIFNTTDTYGATKGTGTRTDANSSAIVLALPMDGANNGTTFSDQSSTIKGSGSAKTATVNGNSKTSTAISKFYGSSGAFDGSGDYLTFASNADFDFGTGDFSVESWVYLNSLPSGNGYPSSYWIVGWGPSDSNPGFDFAVGSSNLILAISNFAAPTISVAHGMSAGRWYHLAATRSGNTARVFVDGVQIGSATTTETASSNPNGIAVCAAEPVGATGGNLNGYLQDLRIYKGVAKYTSNFNPPSTTQNPTVAAGCDSTVDTPSSAGTDTGLGGQVTGNYATLNPLDKSSSFTLTNGNLDCSWTGGVNVQNARGTIAFPVTGKWYYEYIPGGSAAAAPGIGDSAVPFSAINSGSCIVYQENGQKNINGTVTAYGATYGAGDVIGVAYDADANTVTFYKNNVSQGALTPTAGKTYFPLISLFNATCSVNFGQRPFAYTAPSGFKALCDTNLPAPVVAKSSDYFQTVLYTGNGSTQSITTGFSPDLVWIKNRTSAYNHGLWDTVRGATNALYSSLTNAEGTESGVSAFNSDGFSVGSSLGYNKSSDALVAWTWDAGSSTVTNTQGSITSQVRANASAGFSIVSWTGGGVDGSVGHGLGVAPKLYIYKNRSAATNWGACFTMIDGSLDFMYLNLTNAKGDATQTPPSSSVIYLQSSAGDVTAGNNYIAYCFAPVAGYSSFGSYTGNGSADGPFVYTGFRPRWIMWKRTDLANIWFIYDAARDTYNVMTKYLVPNASDAEATYPNAVDYLSNGFKVRNTADSYNASGGTYIYAAFAENPFQYARAR